MHLAAIVEGGWGRAKGIVEALYAALKAEPAFERARATSCSTRARQRRSVPGSSASCTRRVLDGVWGAFELDLAQLLEEAREEVRYADVASFPALHQDLAFAVAEEVNAAELIAAAREAAGARAARDAALRRLPRRAGRATGRKSVAFAVSFQSAERTLTDEDAAALREKIVAALRERFGAELRA